MDTDKKGNRPNGSRTRVVHKVAYAALLVLTGLSYWSIRGFVIAQEPSGEEIVVSNLTLNYVLFALLLGALVPLVTRRLFPKRFKQMVIPVAVVFSIAWILILRTLGVDMRF